jgi:hypothetical protein
MPVKNIDLTIAEPKRAAAAESAETLAQGKALIQRLQQAVGGADKLAAVKDYSQTSEVKVMSVPGGLKVTQITRMIPPKIRFEQKLPFGEMSVYYDGAGGGWMKGPQGVAPLPPPVVKQVKDESFRQHTTAWLSDRNPDRKVNAVGPASFEIKDKDGAWLRIHLDEKTGLPAKANYMAADRSGPVEAEAVYGDWKEVDGIKLPHKISVTQGGKPAAEISVTEYTMNSSVSAEELAKQP